MKLTKRPMQKVIIFRAYPREVDLLRAAAERREISQSDFLRQALRREAGKVLAGATEGVIPQWLQNGEANNNVNANICTETRF
jgi:uncharacterized protein (DUF1778 family)